MASRILIQEKYPRLPYEGRTNLPTRHSNFKVRVQGVVAASPDQFAIDVKEGENILFHFNPRWSENRTVFNTHGPQGWGKEEVAFFPSLSPNQPFDITITCQKDVFHVQVNHDDFVQFRARIPTSGVQRSIAVSKVNHNDINVKDIEVTTGAGN